MLKEYPLDRVFTLIEPGPVLLDGTAKSPVTPFCVSQKSSRGAFSHCCRCGQHPKITPSVFFAIRQKFIDAAFGSPVLPVPTL